MKNYVTGPNMGTKNLFTIFNCVVAKSNIRSDIWEPFWEI